MGQRLVRAKHKIRQTFLMPPSVDAWLPEQPFARLVAAVVEGPDLPAMSRSYRGSGSAPYHPTVLLSILVYGYATGVFSSRKLERARYDSVAVPLHCRERAP
jgi:transposase